MPEPFWGIYTNITYIICLQEIGIPVGGNRLMVWNEW